MRAMKIILVSIIFKKWKKSKTWTPPMISKNLLFLEMENI